MVHHSNGCGWLACLLGGSAVVSALVFSVTGKKRKKKQPGGRRRRRRRREGRNGTSARAEMAALDDKAMTDLVSPLLRRFVVALRDDVIVMPSVVATAMHVGDAGGGGSAAPVRHSGGGGPHRQRGRATPPSPRPQRCRPLAPRTSPL